MSKESETHEILQRVRRIETRQMVIGRALGLDPKERRRIVVKNDDLDMTGFDISLGDIIDFCRKSGITGERALLLHGQHIGYINVDDLDRVSPPPVVVQEAADAFKETHAS
jgi:hypothetical protein